MFINEIIIIVRGRWAFRRNQKRANETTNILFLYTNHHEYIYNLFFDTHIKREKIGKLETSKSLGICPGHNKREYMGVKPATRWGIGDEKMKKAIEEDRIIKKNNTLYLKEDIRGFVESDVWNYKFKHKEYPTQKSKDFLRRIICLSTK